MSEEQVLDAEQVDNAVVDEAVSQGWVEKEKFRGDEKDWVDAPTFVKRGREILPILRKNNENLLRELKESKKSIEEIRATAEEFKKFQKQTYERKAQDLEEQVSQLKAARAQAITDGDGQRVNVLDDAIDTAKEEAKAAKEDAASQVRVTQQAPAIDPQLQEWLDRNEWFGKHDMLTAQTNAIGAVLRRRDPTLVGKPFLEKLDEAIAAEFPEKFGKSKRTPNYQAETGSGRPRPNGAGKQSYENLPKEAKDACDRFVKQKLMTREDYVKEYDWTGE